MTSWVAHPLPGPRFARMAVVARSQLSPFVGVRERPIDRFASVNVDLRTPLDLGLRIWKAGWVQALAGSNPASSAALTRALAPAGTSVNGRCQVCRRTRRLSGGAFARDQQLSLRASVRSAGMPSPGLRRRATLRSAARPAVDSWTHIRRTCARSSTYVWISRPSMPKEKQSPWRSGPCDGSWLG